MSYDGMDGGLGLGGFESDGFSGWGTGGGNGLAPTWGYDPLGYNPYQTNASWYADPAMGTPFGMAQAQQGLAKSTKEYEASKTKSLINTLKGAGLGLLTGGPVGALLGGLTGYIGSVGIGNVAESLAGLFSGMTDSFRTTGSITSQQATQLAAAAEADPALAAALAGSLGNGNGGTTMATMPAPDLGGLSLPKAVVDPWAPGLYSGVDPWSGDYTPVPTGVQPPAATDTAAGGAGTAGGVGTSATYPASKSLAEQLYGSARQSIMDTMPCGGQLLDSLAQADLQKAKTILETESQNDLTRELAKMGANVSLSGQATNTANMQAMMQMQKDISERQNMLDLFTAIGGSGFLDGLF